MKADPQGDLLDKRTRATAQAPRAPPLRATA